jgi:hypothetical protein
LNDDEKDGGSMSNTINRNLQCRRNLTGEDETIPDKNNKNNGASIVIQIL